MAVMPGKVAWGFGGTVGRWGGGGDGVAEDRGEEVAEEQVEGEGEVVERVWECV